MAYKGLGQQQAIKDKREKVKTRKQTNLLVRGLGLVFGIFPATIRLITAPLRFNSVDKAMLNASKIFFSPFKILFLTIPKWIYNTMKGVRM